MNDTLTAEEMIEYITLTKKTPEAVRFIARVNALLARDEGLRRQIEALETLYDSLTLPPPEARRFLLSVSEKERTQQYLN